MENTGGDSGVLSALREKIIPAGTGLTVYRDFEVKTDETIATEPEEYVDLTALVNKTNAL